MTTSSWTTTSTRSCSPSAGSAPSRSSGPRLAEAERAGAARQRFLSDASRALSSSLDLGRTLAELIRLLVPGSTDSAAVFLYDGSETSCS